MMLYMLLLFNIFFLYGHWLMHYLLMKLFCLYLLMRILLIINFDLIWQRFCFELVLFLHFFFIHLYLFCLGYNYWRLSRLLLIKISFLSLL